MFLDSLPIANRFAQVGVGLLLALGIGQSSESFAQTESSSELEKLRDERDHYKKMSLLKTSEAIELRNQLRERFELVRDHDQQTDRYIASQKAALADEVAATENLREQLRSEAQKIETGLRSLELISQSIDLGALLENFGSDRKSREMLELLQVAVANERTLFENLKEASDALGALTAGKERPRVFVARAAGPSDCGSLEDSPVVAAFDEARLQCIAAGYASGRCKSAGAKLLHRSVSYREGFVWSTSCLYEAQVAADLPSAISYVELPRHLTKKQKPQSKASETIGYE